MAQVAADSEPLWRRRRISLEPSMPEGRAESGRNVPHSRGRKDKRENDHNKCDSAGGRR